MVVTVADDLSERQAEAYSDGSGWSSIPGFLAVTQDVTSAAAALHAAAARFRLIDMNGVEHEEWEFLVVLSTPRQVSPVLLADEGPIVWADIPESVPAEMVQGMVRALVEEFDAGGVTAHLTAPTRVPAEMVHGMVRILVEELDARGVTAHLTAPARGVPVSDLPEWQPPPEPDPAPEPAVPKAWFVVREVLLSTTTEREYMDFEFRAADGTWTWDRTAAESHAESPADLLVALRRERRPMFRARTTALLLPVDSSDIQPRPPEHLRRPL